MKTAFRYALLMLFLGGIVYPLTITGIGQVLFPHQAEGSLVRNAKGQIVGSELISQGFSKPEYFHPRPSANSYDASNSGGSNYGATSKKMIDRVITDSQSYRKTENLPASKLIPADAITASASGLDPDISPANAYIQAERVSRTRHISLDLVKQLIAQHTQRSPLGGLSVNVLLLNLALDKGKGA